MTRRTSLGRFCLIIIFLDPWLHLFLLLWLQLRYMVPHFLVLHTFIAISQTRPVYRGGGTGAHVPYFNRKHNLRQKRRKWKKMKRRRKGEKNGIMSNFVTNIMCKELFFLQIKDTLTAFWNKLFGNFISSLSCILRSLSFSLLYHGMTVWALQDGGGFRSSLILTLLNHYYYY